MGKSIRHLLCALLVVLCLCSCSKSQIDDFIVGKWVVTAYEVNDKIYNKDEMCDIYGENFADIERPILLFQKSGYVRIYKGSEKGQDFTVKYTITEDIIELYNDDEHGLYLEIVDNTIKCNFDSQDFTLIYTKEQ